MKRKIAWLLPAGVLILAILICATVFREPLAVAYHEWRMNAALDTFYGDPDPNGGYNVTGIDIDAVMNAYRAHRQALAELGAYCHLQADFPELASNGSMEQSHVRDAFSERMQNTFPGRLHSQLNDDGHFEVWAPVAEQADWKLFLQTETSRAEEQRSE